MYPWQKKVKEKFIKIAKKYNRDPRYIEFIFESQFRFFSHVISSATKGVPDTFKNIHSKTFGTVWTSPSIVNMLTERWKKKQELLKLILTDGVSDGIDKYDNSRFILNEVVYTLNSDLNKIIKTEKK